MRDNAVKRTLEGGGVSIGTFVAELVTPAIGRMAAYGGAEFMLIDQEHTGLSLETVKTTIAAARAHDIVPLVRVPDAHYHLVAGALDVDAMGIMVPVVESVEEARAIASWARFPPVGERGCGLYHPDSRLPAGLGATQAQHNDQTLVIVQIESVKGLEIVDEIAAVDGVDVLWVGHADLTTSMGIPGQFEHPRFLEAIKTIGSAVQANSKVAGMLATTPQDAQLALDSGFRMIAYSVDMWLYAAALRAGVDDIRARADALGVTR